MIDRLKKIIDPALQATEFGYNARSERTSVEDGLNQTYLFTYDAVGQLIQETRAGTSMSYQYDAVGNVSQRTDYNGAVTNYSYDDVNRLTTIAYPNSTSATYGYDVLSRLTSATNQNGTVSFSYDNRSRVSSTPMSGAEPWIMATMKTATALRLVWEEACMRHTSTMLLTG